MIHFVGRRILRKRRLGEQLMDSSFWDTTYALVYSNHRAGRARNWKRRLKVIFIWGGSLSWRSRRLGIALRADNDTHKLRCGSTRRCVGGVTPSHVATPPARARSFTERSTRSLMVSENG